MHKATPPFHWVPGKKHTFYFLLFPLFAPDLLLRHPWQAECVPVHEDCVSLYLILIRLLWFALNSDILPGFSVLSPDVYLKSVFVCKWSGVIVQPSVMLNLIKSPTKSDWIWMLSCAGWWGNVFGGNTHNVLCCDVLCCTAKQMWFHCWQLHATGAWEAY
jgi:hypothetical protein